MAIQTGGFGVDVMPRYVAPNPSLVAFNPTQVSDGMMSAFNLAKAWEQIKSQKALQAELEATRQKRIAAQNAQNNLAALTDDARTSLVEPQVGLDLSRINAQTGLVPLEAQSKASDLNFNIGKNQAFQPNLGLLAQAEAGKANADLTTFEPLAKAKVAIAGAQAAEAGQDTINAPLKAAAQRSEYELATKKNNTAYTRLDKENELIDKRLQFDLDNAETDAEVLRATKKANQEKIDAETKYTLAHAKYLEAQGINLPTKGSDKISAQLAAVSAEKNRLMTEKFQSPDGSVMGNLATYVAQRYPNGYDGKVGQSGIIFKNDLPKNPIAESLLEDFNRAQKTHQILLRQLEKAYKDEGIDINPPAAAGIAAPQGKILPPTSLPIGSKKTVIQNGKSYNVQWNGQKWVEVNK